MQCPCPLAQAPAPQNSLQATSMPTSPALCLHSYCSCSRKTPPLTLSPEASLDYLSPKLGLAPKARVPPPTPSQPQSSHVSHCPHPADFSTEGRGQTRGRSRGWSWCQRSTSYPLLGTYCVPGTGNNMNMNKMDSVPVLRELIPQGSPMANI